MGTYQIFNSCSPNQKSNFRLDDLQPQTTSVETTVETMVVRQGTMNFMTLSQLWGVYYEHLWYLWSAQIVSDLVEGTLYRRPLYLEATTMAFLWPWDLRSVSSWRCWIGGWLGMLNYEFGSENGGHHEMAILNGENDANPWILEVPYSKTNPFRAAES
jgi:hypothetical protein